MEKYSEIFEKKGFDTVWISSNTVNTVLRLNRTKEISFELLDILKEMKSNQNQPVILYALSMGGFMVHHFIKEAISTPGRPHYNSIHVVGCIFDSCPTFLNFNSLKEHLRVSKTVQKPLIKLLMQFGLVVVYPAFLLSPAVRHHIVQACMSSLLGCPELFLFSKTDYVIPYKDVETFRNAHKDKGIKVFSKHWEHSAHVQHYKNYPEEYLGQINAFTESCLKQQA